MDCFKDMRRPRRAREEVKGDQVKPKKERVLAKKAPGAHTCNPALALPEVPEGEDSTLYEHHNRVLVAEWKQTSRNTLVVEELMSKPSHYGDGQFLMKALM